jgi:carboxypeptidase family protein
MHASKTGYGRRELVVSAAGPIEIRLSRAAAVAGRVVDDFGDPIVSARVVVEAVGTSSPPPTTATTTDDAGEYRLAGLTAGSVVVACISPQALMLGPFNPEAGKTYYPGVLTAAAAERFQLEPGSEATGIDFVLPNRWSGPQPTLIMGPGNQLMLPPRLAAGTGIVRGQVRTADGRPVPRASIMLVAYRGAQWQDTVADADGAFELRDVPAGRYQVRASKSGYSYVFPTSPASAELASEQSFDLKDGETRDRITLGLVRWRALAGRIFDELGDPLQGASVSVMQVKYEAGRRRLVPAAAATRVTDDFGRYRIFNLPPGRYIVSAAIGSVSSDDVPGYARGYHPGTPNASEAQYVSVGSSQDTAGIDFSMSRVRTARISGRAITSGGTPINGGLNLVSSRSSAVGVSFGARIKADGSFEFPNVPPGQYVIQAYRGRSNESTEGEFAALSVSVNGEDITGLVLQTATGSRIAGRVRFETVNGAKTPQPSSIAVSPIPSDFDAAPALPAVGVVRSDWTFELNGINGSRRLQLVRTPPEWTLAEIRVNGIPATDRVLQFAASGQRATDVEVVLTDRLNQIAATITGEDGAPAAAARVLAFSTSRSDWYYGSRFLSEATTDERGTATFIGLPMASYSIVAMPAASVPAGEGWQDPGFLDALARTAATVTLGTGDRRAVQLRLSAPPR